MQAPILSIKQSFSLDSLSTIKHYFSCLRGAGIFLQFSVLNELELLLPCEFCAVGSCFVHTGCCCCCWRSYLSCCCCRTWFCYGLRLLPSQLAASSSSTSNVAFSEVHTLAASPASPVTPTEVHLPTTASDRLRQDPKQQ